MDYISSKEDTIAAISTPIGEGAISIVRMSGQNAVEIACQTCSGPLKNYKSHTAHQNNFLGANGEKIDEVIFLIMRAPNSYTGEDIIEVHCHGSLLVTKKILKTFLELGARPALPGEFSFRAFYHGRLDLTQAEAVQDLITAKNSLALTAAKNNLEGAFSKAALEIQTFLTDTLAFFEACTDFPEEGIEEIKHSSILNTMEMVKEKIERLLTSYDDGKIMGSEITLCIAGKTNVGKSTLMNALAGKERSIVSEIPGTTRDFIEEKISIRGINFSLIDTAGIRNTEEKIEAEGIARSKSEILKADIVLLLMDASQPLGEEDKTLFSLIAKEKTIFVWNKTDLKLPEENLSFPNSIFISAKEKIGLDELKNTIEKLIWKNGPPAKEEIFLVKERHKIAFDLCLENLKKATSGLETSQPFELISFDLRESLKALNEITGKEITEEVLNSIFSKFCIGK